MTDPNEPNPGYLARAGSEISGMARQGLAHPSTKPVLTGVAIGAIAAILLPVLTIPIGVIGGGGIALWRRIRA